jgi:hypothetical protein
MRGTLDVLSIEGSVAKLDLFMGTSVVYGEHVSIGQPTQANLDAGGFHMQQLTGSELA